MKLERINENQIRFTLNREDLASRHLRLSELAYGSEKAKALFRELMTKAKGELDFDAADEPLMVEAIPVSADCLILVVTKVEEPDELDTRFSNFTDDPDDNVSEEDWNSETAYADDVLNSLGHISEMFAAACTQAGCPEGQPQESVVPLPELTEAMTKVYSFSSLDAVIDLSKVIVPFFNGKNSLFKDEKTQRYYLVISMAGHSALTFNKVCNILSEYGTLEKTGYARLSYFTEHCDVIVKDSALQAFARV